VYEKSPQEDLNSMVKGLMGHKGRVRLTFGEPISCASSAEELAAQLDQSIVANTQLYPTHRYAKMVLENSPTQELENHPAVQHLAAELHAMPSDERPYLLRQYANIWRNRDELNIV
jgi:hypothetical protein